MSTQRLPELHRSVIARLFAKSEVRARSPEPEANAAPGVPQTGHTEQRRPEGARAAASRAQFETLLAATKLGEGPATGRQLSRRAEARLASDRFVQRLGKLD